MKLALVRQKYNAFGGAERFVERALQSLHGHGAAVTLITRGWKPAGNVNDYAVRICNPAFSTRKGRDSGFARDVQRIIAGNEFDLVQSHERIPGCHLYRAGDGVHATWLERRARVQSPLARMATRLHPWHRYILRAEATMFQHRDLRAVICNSDMVKRDIAARFNVADQKLHVIHNGVDVDYFHPALRDQFRDSMRTALCIPGDTPVLLFVGSGFERKGLPSLLRAFAAMRHRDAFLLVVGRDRQQMKMQKLSRDLGVADRTRFVGAQADVRPYYAAADVFALPTLYDPFPNAALEALACGLPVLTSPDSGAAELMNAAHGTPIGEIADALDWRRQAVALDGLVDNAVSMRGAARIAAECCSLTDMTACLTALYSSLGFT